MQRVDFSPAAISHGETLRMLTGGFMRVGLFIAVSIAFVAASSAAQAQSRADQCSAYARDRARSPIGTTGPLRGAARGAAGGAIGGAIAGNAGRGAGIGAAVGAGIGTVRRAGQRNEVYQWHFNECMRWP
jgi:Glycine-zipper domain